MAITKLVVGYQEYPKNIKYPILARWKPTGQIVLFGKDTNGLIIEDPQSDKIGNAVSNFYPLSHGNWEILPIGTKLTIRNTL